MRFIAIRFVVFIYFYLQKSQPAVSKLVAELSNVSSGNIFNSQFNN